MGLVFSEIGGLTVATSSSDYQSVQRAIKEIDDCYMLDDLSGAGDWVVLCRRGSEMPPDVVVTWRDENGNPLPLSSGLVEKVKRLRADSRWTEPDPDVLNEKLRERNRVEFEDHVDEITRKHTNRELRFFFGETQLNKRAIGVAHRRGRDKGINR